MSIFDSRLFAWIRPQRDGAQPPLQLNSRAIAGGRQTVDTSFAAGFGTAFTFVPPPDYDAHWQMTGLDARTMNRMNPTRLQRLMLDLSPEISAGVWNFLRLANPGWEVEALRPGSDEQDARAQQAVEAFLAALPSVYAAPQQAPADTVINALFLGAFLRGAFMAELVLDEAGRTPLNIATPDPASARFRRVSDERLGAVYELGQWQGGRWVTLDSETVRYVPIDPAPGEPYGRPLITPAMFGALFLLGLLHDLRRVVQQQGYPRLDLEVVLENLMAVMPHDLESDPEAMQAWVQAAVDEVMAAYSRLEPDDAYVHLDVVKVNRPVGAVDAQSLSAVDGLISAVERMVSRGLKMMPLVMGVNDATTETNANRAWELQAAAIKSIQHLLETLMEHLLTIALQVQGIRATVHFRFAELRASELLRDAMTEQMNIANAVNMYAAGWISQDEAAEMVVGHPADVPAPRAVVSGAQWPTGIDPSNEDRTMLLEEIRQARKVVEEAMSEPIDERAHSNGHEPR